jgi:protein-tyrosine-phosphatase
MAEAFFNKYAEGKATAVSAGSNPGDRVNPVVVEAMSEEGIDISGNKPKALTIDMMEKADRVISMGCGVEDSCPATLVETEDWNLEDPSGKSLEEVRKIRDEIKLRVQKLIKDVIK